MSQLGLQPYEARRRRRTEQGALVLERTSTCRFAKFIGLRLSQGLVLEVRCDLVFCKLLCVCFRTFFICLLFSNSGGNI